VTTPALRKAWDEWDTFAEGLDLSDDSPDCAVLHGRLFRLCGAHTLRARDLRDTRDAFRAAFGPWLGEEPAEAGDLEQLRRAMTACEPGWRALLRMTATQTNWGEVERVARTAGLAWPEGPFWASPLYVAGQDFDLLAALRGRDHAASLALLDALLRILNHPQGETLFEWARKTPVLSRPAEALRAAALFRDTAEEGALQEEWLGPLGWQPLVERLLRLCQDVCLCLLNRLTEPMPAAARPTARKGAAARLATYRRAVPDPLPIEPFFRTIRGSEAFLRAIAEEPLEDAHRLALADWLEEKGHDERARFIRLQCEHDRLPDIPLARRRHAEEIAALFKAHGAAWTAGLPECSYVTWNEATNFRRGLLEHLTTSHPPADGDYPRIFGAVDLRGMRTAFYGPFCPREQTGEKGFLARPYPSRLVSLFLPDAYAGDLRGLAAAPALAGLVHLGASGSYLDASAVRGMAEVFRLPALAALELSSSRIGDEGVRVLTAGTMAANLRWLRLTGTRYRRRDDRIGLPGIRALASSPAVARLEHLDVSENRAAAAGIESLAASPFLANLSTLVLNYCNVGTRGAQALGSSPFLRRLTCLGLRSSGVRDEAVRILAASANLAGLAVLDLGDNRRFGEVGLGALGSSPHVSGLRALSLSGVPLTAGAVQALAESPNFASLEILDLSQTGMDGTAVKALVASPHLNNLAVLDLRQQYKTLPSAAKGAVRKRWRFAQM
jgi:uncharacterized protein (TIGR02996 family)